MHGNGKSAIDLLNEIQRATEDVHVSASYFASILSKINNLAEEVKEAISEEMTKPGMHIMCRYYKGQHYNDYEDCTVCCSLHDDDYVSRDSCLNCSDFDLSDKGKKMVRDMLAESGNSVT